MVAFQHNRDEEAENGDKDRLGREIAHRHERRLIGDDDAGTLEADQRDKKADTAKGRISQKRGKITGQMNGKKGDDTDTPDATTDTQINESQLKELRNNLMNGLDVQNYSRNAQYGGGSFSKEQHW